MAIQEQTNMESGCTKVGFELDKVNIVKSFNSLQLQNYPLSCNEVYASLAGDLAFELDANRNLRLERD